MILSSLLIRCGCIYKIYGSMELRLNEKFIKGAACRSFEGIKAIIDLIIQEASRIATRVEIEGSGYNI